MSIIMFAVVGALIEAPIGYWIAYGVFTSFKAALAMANVMSDN